MACRRKSSKRCTGRLSTQCAWQGAAATCWGQRWCRSLRAAQCIMEPRYLRWHAPFCRDSALPPVLALHCLRRTPPAVLAPSQLQSCSPGVAGCPLGLLAWAGVHSPPAAPRCWLHAGPARLTTALLHACMHLACFAAQPASSACARAPRDHLMRPCEVHRHAQLI